MKLTEICIKRPVLASVLSLILIVFGSFGFHYLHSRFFPNIDLPFVMVQTQYPGASASLIESSVTTPIEHELLDLSGIDHISSESVYGYSRIFLSLKQNSDTPQEMEDIRAAVDSAEADFPSEVQTPRVMKMSGEDEIMEVGVTSSTMDLAATRDYVNRYLKSVFLAVPGVSEVDPHGIGEYAMYILLNPVAMATHGISLTDVENALKNNNIEMPAGELRSKTMDFEIKTNLRFKTAAQFNNLVVAVKNGEIIHLSDIGYAHLGTQDNANWLYYNGKPVIDMGINAANGASEITVYDGVIKAIKHQQAMLPQGMKLFPVFTIINYLKRAIHDVYFSIGSAIIFVMLIIFLFLGSVRATLVPFVTIPVCLMATFGFMFVFGFSINVLTLMALVLSIGLVVDDAIVMLENIQRHIDSGTKPFHAAIKGSREISYPIIAMTLTLAAVYAPIGFMQGFIATLFRQFAFALTCAVLVSGFVALTLSPSLCARVLKTHNKERGYSRFIHHFFESLHRGYQRVLVFVLHFRLYFILIALAASYGGYLTYTHMARELWPKENIGLISAYIQGKPGTNQQTIKNYATQIRQVMHTLAPDNMTFTNIKNHQNSSGFVRMLLPEGDDPEVLANELRKKVDNIPGINTSISIPSLVGGGSNNGYGFSFYLTSSASYTELYKQAQHLSSLLRKYPGLEDVNINLGLTSQQYQAKINLAKANALGISGSTVSMALAAFMGEGEHVTDFEKGGQQYYVLLRAQKQYLSSTQALQYFNVISSTTGKLVSLAELVELKPTVDQAELDHYNGLRALTVYAQITPNYTLGQVVSYVESLFKSQLPNNMGYAFTGNAKHYVDSSNSMVLIFGAALIFIYLVLAAQFESYIDPLIILFTVPLSVTGGVVTLYCVGGTINIFTEIALVTLIGLVTKHGILITQFTNTLRREQGLGLQEALIKGATLRLRPILMTTGAMVLGALPLALATGTGAASRQQLGWVIVGGMLLGTFFSLILVPIAYSYLSRFKKD